MMIFFRKKVLLSHFMKVYRLSHEKDKIMTLHLLDRTVSDNAGYYSLPLVFALIEIKRECDFRSEE
jgi:hypothetical protein